MDDLARAIALTPIIDNHAHNLLESKALAKHDLLSITSEASGSALKDAESTLAHLRAVKQLSSVLGCQPQWTNVKSALERQRERPEDAWARRCFEGLETVLIDDGLDPTDIYPYHWHDRLMKTNCKRILRVERVAEYLITKAIADYRKSPPEVRRQFPDRIADTFNSTILEALESSEIAGFKSVICYRTGLDIPTCVHRFEESLLKILDNKNIQTYSRLEDSTLNPFFVHLTARLIQGSKTPKPFQFHTGLGDNDISLRLSNPSHLQPFIKMYDRVPVVLLHASYPFTAEAGYLASVYKHVYLDIGEVFPMVSQEGQERIVADALALCPSEKLCWSTDGHWFPETYLLAVIQIREALNNVLGDYVQNKAITESQAIKIVRDLLFDTSNKLYRLNLEFRLLDHAEQLPSRRSDTTNSARHLRSFLSKHPDVKYVRLQWLDYTSTYRMRIIPIERALKMAKEQKFLGITKAVLGLLQQDIMTPGTTAVGEYHLRPDYSSLRKTARDNYVSAHCFFHEKNGADVPTCPRTLLKKQLDRGGQHGLSFLVGFEVEIVFMRSERTKEGFKFGETSFDQGGHAWSTARAVGDSVTMDLLDSILDRLKVAGVEVEQFHPESAPGQYEFIFPPQPPMQAIDDLLVARDIISSIAASSSIRTTLIPKPYVNRCGNGAHVHISVQPAEHWEAFYGGILNHLRAITAFTYSKEVSYERVSDGTWSGGTWVAWGTQNRETPLRRIEDSHFEIKCMDGLANPYMALAAIIGSGVQSILEAQSLASTSSSASSPTLPSPATPKTATSPDSVRMVSPFTNNSFPIRTRPKSRLASITTASDIKTQEQQQNKRLISPDCLFDPATLTSSQRQDLGITQRLPASLHEALDALEKDKWLIEEVLGEDFVQKYLKVKKAEAQFLADMENDEERRNWLIEWY